MYDRFTQMSTVSPYNKTYQDTAIVIYFHRLNDYVRFFKVDS